MPIRKACGRNDIERPKFDIDVKPNGYAWWYVDGISNDGNRAISIIGFIGSVFSPWYYWSKRKDPQNHVCINVAMYGKGWRWTMTERGKQKLKRTQNMLKVGPSSFNWNKDHLIINFDEYSIPHFDNVKGTVKIIPKFISEIECNLLSDNSHVWRPFSPISRIEVDINKPGWQWEGHGYFDANFGSNALEKDFSYWTWGRFPTDKGSYTFYDAIPRKEKDVNIALLFKNNGRIEKIDFNYEDRPELIITEGEDGKLQQVETGRFVFDNNWQSFKTRESELELTSATYQYPNSGTYKIAVKVIDVFGNDTTRVFEATV